MKYHKTNLELLRALSLQYLCYASNQVLEEEIQRVDRSDQRPVHEVSRPVQPRQVHKEHRPVPVLRMNPLTTRTSTEKENLAQQYRVLHPDLYALTSDEHWSMTSEAHKYAAAARSFRLATTECVQRSLCIDNVINNPSSVQVEVPKEFDSQTRDMLERCMATCGKAVRARAKRRSRASNKASAQEVRGYCQQLVKPKNYVTSRWVLVIKTDKHCNFFRAKARWVLRGFQDKPRDYLQTDSPALPDLDFG